MLGQNILNKDIIKSLSISYDQKTDHFPPIVQCGKNLEGFKQLNLCSNGPISQQYISL